MAIETSDTEIDIDQLADTLLHRGVPDPDATAKNVEESIVLTYGAKCLTVWVDTVDRVMSTNVESTDDEAKPYETTILYTAAKKFMQRAVEDLGAEYLYQLSTKNTRMRDWARGPGNDVFHWTDIVENQNGNELYSSFVTTFKPTRNEPEYKVT